MKWLALLAASIVAASVPADADPTRRTYANPIDIELFADRLDPRRPSHSLRALDVGQAYWVAVEAFNEVGVSELSKASPLGSECAELPPKP